MSRAIILLFVIGVTATLHAADGAKDLPRARKFEDEIRSQLRADTHPSLTPGESPIYRPLGERLLLAAQRAGVTKAELQATLFNLVEEGYKVARADLENGNRGDAGGALSGLKEVADATAIERLAELAADAPPKLWWSAADAAVCVANREALGKLPMVVRRLAQNENPDPIYISLDEILRTSMQKDSVDREGRIAIIIGIFKDGIYNKNADRIFIDETLSKYEPSYRRSDDRKRLLKELCGDEYENGRKYGIKMLSEVFSISDKAAIAVIPVLDHAVDKPNEKTAPKKIGSETINQPAAAPEFLSGLSKAAVAGGVIALLLLALGFIWWRKNR